MSCVSWSMVQHWRWKSIGPYITTRDRWCPIKIAIKTLLVQQDAVSVTSHFHIWRCGRTYTVYSFLWRKTGESLVRFIRFVYISEVKSYYACHTFRYLLLLKSIVRSWLSIGSLLRSSVGLSGSLRSRSLNLYQVWYIAPNVLYINAHFVAITLN